VLNSIVKGGSSMNLMEKVNELKKLNKDLRLNAVKQADGYYRINDWMKTSDALNRLLEHDFIKDKVEKIFNVDNVIYIRTNTWITPGKTYEKLEREIEILSESIDSCIKLLEEYVVGSYEIPEGNGILSVRMPDILDMNKLSNICEELDKVFNQCPLIKDEVKFVGVEKGSVHFIFVTSLISITIVGKMLNVALDVQRKYYLNKMLKIKLETMEKFKEATDPLIKELENEVKRYCEERAKQIEESKNLENEDLKRLAFSIQTLSTLIDQGVQIQCVLYEGQVDSDLTFPTKDDYKSLINTVKLLKQG